jgi:hypothetical protein
MRWLRARAVRVSTGSGKHCSYCGDPAVLLVQDVRRWRPWRFRRITCGRDLHTKQAYLDMTRWVTR